MEIEQLREFLDLSKTCNVQETADNMNMSQSSISNHMRKLEDELGVYLFDRSARNIQLNEYGRALMDYAQKIIDLRQQAQMELEKIKSNGSYALKVGFSPVIGRYNLIKLISDFQMRHPEIKLSLVESSNSRELLNNFQCDIFFAPEYELFRMDVRCVPYMQDSLIAVLPAGHPLQNEKSVSLTQLRNENFIIHSKFQSSDQLGSNFIMRLCKENGFTPKTASIVSMTATAVKFVEQNRGIALLYRRQFGENSANVITIDIKPAITTNICASFLKGRNLPDSARTFLKYMKLALFDSPVIS